MSMKKVVFGVLVPEESIQELQKKIQEFVESKKGKAGEMQVSDAPPQGAGATLSGVL